MAKLDDPVEAPGLQESAALACFPDGRLASLFTRFTEADDFLLFFSGFLLGLLIVFLRKSLTLRPLLPKDA
jgi:hypothetical protein